MAFSFDSPDLEAQSAPFRSFGKAEIRPDPAGAVFRQQMNSVKSRIEQEMRVQCRTPAGGPGMTLADAVSEMYAALSAAEGDPADTPEYHAGWTGTLPGRKAPKP